MNVYSNAATSSSSAATASSSVASSASPSSSTPASTGLPTGWNYKGCWVDNGNGRVMANQIPDASDMTIEHCIGNCSSRGYGIAGIEYSYQCFCDNFLRNAATRAPESDCNMKCSGNSQQNCGAGDRLSLYSNSTANVTVYPVPGVQKTGLPGSWQYSKCIHDDADGGVRALPYQIILQDTNSANNCIKRCSDYGYEYGGLEYGSECYVSLCLRFTENLLTNPSAVTFRIFKQQALAMHPSLIATFHARVTPLPCVVVPGASRCTSGEEPR